jgi:diacylglycerol kinase family enzyme
MAVGDVVRAVALVAAIAVAVLLILWVRRRARRSVTAPTSLSDPHSPRPAPRAAVIVNPTKLRHPVAERAWLTGRCTALGWADPLWIETTEADPGPGQARQALAAGVDTVIVFGGDGTVRAVAAEIAGTGMPLGILAAGTGNLLARNLLLPVADLDASLDVALTGSTRQVDVVRAEIDVSGEDHDVRRETFLVMAGLGFDAEVMATVEPELKERVGWWAYVVAGVARMTGTPTRAVLLLDDGEPLTVRMRSVLVGNCGMLTGGLAMMPDATLDDGVLDVAVVAPRGVVGWGAVVAGAVTRARRNHPVVRHLQCRSIEIRCEKPLHVQLDGDAAESARVLRARVDPGALLVRVPGP